MSIAEYKKEQNKTKIIDLKFFKVKIRKAKDKDYLGFEGLPSLLIMDDKKEESPVEDFSSKFKIIKHLVCRCVIGNKEKDMPAIVDKPEHECKDFEISFEDTLTSNDCIAIFNAINEFTSEGGESVETMDSFREKSESSESDTSNGKGIREISA